LNQLHPGVQLRQRAQRLDELEQRLIRSLRANISQRTHRLQTQTARLHMHSPTLQLTHARNRFEQVQNRLLNSWQEQRQRIHNRLAIATKTLHTLSPLATLTRGYAIVSDAYGHSLSDTQSVSVGETINARLAQGQITATITDIKTDE
jgi:exodeoxyribonuclease VII large subunit